MANKLTLDLELNPQFNTLKVSSSVRKLKASFDTIADIDLPDIGDFEDELEAADKAVRELERDLEKIEDELDDLIDGADKLGDSLKGMTPKSIDELASALKATRGELSEMFEKQKAAAAQMVLDGQKGSAEWKKLQAEIKETREQLEEIDDALGEVKDLGGESIFEKMFAFESIAKAGEFLNGIAEKGAEAGAQMKRLKTVSGETGAGLDALREQGNQVFRALGGSIAEAREAMVSATQTLKGVIPMDQLDEAAIFGKRFGAIWDKDVTETLGKSAPFIQNFGLKGKEAFDLIALGQRDAMTADDDFLDTIKEYSVSFNEAGFSAQEFVGTLIKGKSSGAFNLDKVADGVKEATIRITSAGNDVGVALQEINGAPDALKSKLENALADVRSGKINIKDFFSVSAKDIQGAFDAGQITQTVKKQLEIAIGGSPLEDLGEGMFTKLFSAPIDTKALQDRAKQAGAALTSNPGLIDKVKREIEILTTTATEFLSPVISGGGAVLSTIGQIGPGVVLLQDKFKVFDVASGFIKKMVAGLFASVPAIGAEAVATEGATVAQLGLNLAQNAMPILAIVAGVGAIVAAFLLLGDHTKDLGEAIDDVNKKLKDFNEAQAHATEVKAASDGLRSLADEYDRLKDKTDPESQRRFQDVANQLAQSVPDASEVVEQLGDKGEHLADKMTIATSRVREFAAEQQKMADQEAAEQLEALTDEAAALVDSYHASTENLKDLKAEREDLKEETTGELIAKMYSGEVLTRAIGLTNTQKEAQVEVNQEIAEESKKRAEGRKKIVEMIDLLVKQGKSQDEIKQLLHLSDEDAKAFSASLGKAQGSAQAAAGATSGLQAAAERAKTSVADLAAAYDKVRSAADAAYSNTFKAVLALKQEQRSATTELQRLKKQEADAIAAGNAAMFTEEQRQRKIFLEQRLKDLPGEIKQEIDAAKQALQDKKALDLEETKLKLQVGEIDLNVTDLTEQARQIRREIGDILFDIANADVANEVKQAQDKIQHDLENNLKAIDDQMRAVRKQIDDAAGDPTKAIKGAGDLFSALRAKRKALEDQAAAEKIRVEKELNEKLLEELKKLLAQEQALIDASIDARVQALEIEEAAITATSDDALTDRLQKRAQIINLIAAQELSAIVNGNEEYLKAYGELQFALRTIDEAKDAAGKEAAIKHATELRAKLGLIEQQIISGDPKALAIQLKRQQELDKAAAELLDARYQRELKALEKKQARELEEKKHAAELEQQLLEDMVAFTEELGTRAIDDKIGKKIRELEDLHDQELIGEEEFQSRKAALEEKGAQDSEALQARLRGIRLEGERLAALEELKVKRDMLLEKKRLAEESGKVDEANAIGEELDDLQVELDSKGKILSGLAGEIQGNLTETFTNLFAGDEAAVKAPFRKAFSAIAGGLQQLASAKVAEVLLSAIGPTGIGGLVATFLLKPLISSLIATISTPIINGILSFPTGYRADEPTLALIGDRSRLGGPIDREWVLSDEHMRMLFSEVLDRFSGGMVAVLLDVLGAIRGLDGRFYVLQSDVSKGRGRSKAEVRRRQRGTGLS